MAKILLANGWNRVTPPVQIPTGDGAEIDCSILENYICGDNRIKKIGGTEAYNATSLGAKSIPWCLRSYHLRGIGSIVKRTFGFYDGDIYYGDDVAGTLTISNATGFRKTAIPLSASFQVAGNSILYFYTGEDTPMKYDGNDAFEWETTGLGSDIISGTDHLQRMWYLHKLSSTLSFSTSLVPETIDDEILVGDNAKDSHNVAIWKLGNERFFVAKNNSIWELQGRTTSQFRFIRITDRFGLANKRAWVPIGGGIIFLNEDDKELHFFGGTEASIKPLTEKNIRLREVQDQTPDSINNSTMTIHKNYFRYAFQHRDTNSFDGNDCELVYPLNDPRPDGSPKWSLIRGSNAMSYTRFNKYGDNNDLVTGRSDAGKLMYHDRTNDFDGTAITTKFRTAEIVASEGNTVRFGGFWIKGKPGSHNLPMKFSYYMNGRFSDYGELEGVVPEGETRSLGSITMSKSSLFNDRIVPKKINSRGNSISFEVEDDNLGTDMELYSIAFTARKLRKMRNQLP